MSSLRTRILTACVAVPAIFVIIFILPQFHHLAFFLLVLWATLEGTHELQALIQKASGSCPSLPFWVSSLEIVAAWLETFLVKAFPLVDFTFIILVLLSFSMEIFQGTKNKFKSSISHIGASSFMLLYPAFFFTFLVRISVMEKSVFLLLLYFLLVFGNDTCAYLFGMTFGKKSKGILPASPNKSTAGFLGGFFCTILLSVLFCLFIDIGVTWGESILLGAIISMTANIGDLVESTIKRSAGVKDSGTIIPGRGGLLDSIDSLLASAPLFWLAFQFFQA